MPHVTERSPSGAAPALLPGARPVAVTEEQLAQVRYTADGLVPAIVQSEADGSVLMMAWMTEETLRLTLAEGRTVFWSRSRGEVWRKGDTSGDVQLVRGAYYDCDGDVLLFVVDQAGEGACHTGRAHLLLPGLRPRRRRAPPVISPSRDDFRALARRYTVIPVWRELLADLTTPVAAFCRVVGDEPGFLLESVEHGEARWSRWSFIGRNPLATLTCRGREVDVAGTIPAEVPRDQGILAALDVLLAAWRAPSLPDLPPLHGGVIGYLGYDVVREVEHLPDVPPDDLGHADAVMSVIGQLVAYDHWRQRVVLDRQRAGPRGRRPTPSSTPSTTARSPGSTTWPQAGTRPIDEPLVEPPTADDAAARRALDARHRLVLPGGRGRPRAHPGRRHLPGRAVAALRLRPAGRAVRRLPGPPPGQPQPLHVLRAPARAVAGGGVARADGAGHRRHGRCPARSPAPAAAAPPTRRTPASPAS